MKHIFAIALFAATSLSASTSASAQTVAQQVTVPFEFTVGEKLLPAGTYLIKGIQPGMVLLQNREGRANMFSPILSTDTVNKASNRLIFNKYGDQYFLSEIRGSVGETAAKIVTSNLEKRVRAQEAKLQNEQKAVVAMK